MVLLQPLYDTSFLIKSHLYLQNQSQFYKWENLPLPFFSCEASLINRKMSDWLTGWFTISYFHFIWYLQTSDEKISFTKCFLFVPSVSKLIFKTGNGIIQTGNGIISPTSRPLIKKLLLQNVPHLFQVV